MAKPFYQPVVDKLKGSVAPPSSLGLLLELCKAIEAGNAAKIMVAAPKFTKNVSVTDGGMAGLPDAVFLHTLRELMFLGRDVEFRMLFDWYAQRYLYYTKAPYEWRAAAWDEVMALVALPTPKSTENELKRQFEQAKHAIAVVLASHALAQGAPVPMAQQGGDAEIRAIDRAIVKLTTWLMWLFEQALDAALVHFGAKGADRGSKLLALHQRWSEIRRHTFGRAPHADSVPLARLTLPLTVMKIEPDKNLYLDAFPPHEGRSFQFFVYNRDDKQPPKPETVWLSELLRVRGVQLRYFLALFGELFPQDPVVAPTVADKDAETRREKRFTERRALIDKAAGKVKTLDIRTEDGMADFLCAFFNESVAARKQTPTPQARLEAWDEVIDILAFYGMTQTMHSEFNLAEKPMYLGRMFPRTLHGGQLFDCGVYAVKAAYILLKLGACITRKGTGAPIPEAAFLLLPIHIGLVVKIDEFPWVVVQNETIKWLEPEDEKRWRKEWDNGSGDDSTRDPQDAAGKDRKFIEDFAAQHYISELDMPITRIPFDKVSSPPKKEEIWGVYERANNPTKPIRVFADSIEKTGAKDYQFDLKYLKAQENERKWHNEKMVTFWNVDCHKLWVASTKQLTTMQGREQYARKLEKLLEPVAKAYDTDVRKFKIALSEELRTAPAVAKPAQRITASLRVIKATADDIGPLGAIRRHLVDVRDTKLKTVPPPGFATEDGFLRPTMGI